MVILLRRTRILSVLPCLALCFAGAFISSTYYKLETTLLSGSPTSSIGHAILTVTKYVILLVPPLNFSLAIEKFVMAWRVNHMAEAYAQQGLEDTVFEAKSK